MVEGMSGDVIGTFLKHINRHSSGFRKEKLTATNLSETFPTTLRRFVCHELHSFLLENLEIILRRTWGMWWQLPQLPGVSHNPGPVERVLTHQPHPGLRHGSRHFVSPLPWGRGHGRWESSRIIATWKAQQGRCLTPWPKCTDLLWGM